jgi:hypothetical protein
MSQFRDVLPLYSNVMVSIEDYGAVSLYDSAGYNSTSALQDWIDAYGITEFRGLYIPGKPYGIDAGEIVFPTRTGYTIFAGGGATDVRGEAEYLNPTSGTNVGGCPARLCRLSGSGAMLQFLGSTGVEITGTLSIQGYYNAAASRGQLIADSSNFADIGVWFTENTLGNRGADGARIDALHTSLCNIGIQQGVDATDINSNGLSIQSCGAAYCNKGFYGLGNQTVNNWFGRYVSYGDLADDPNQIAMHSAFGGDWQIDFVSHEIPKLFLKCDLQSASGPSFDIGIMAVDSAANGGALFEITADGGPHLFNTATYIKVRSLNLDAFYATEVWATLRAASILEFGGSGHYNNCIRTIAVTDGDTFTPNVIANGVRFRNGVASLALGAATGNTGRSDFRYRNCCKYAGQFFADTDQSRTGDAAPTTLTYTPA